jgi:hypothetical protein
MLEINTKLLRQKSFDCASNGTKEVVVFGIKVLEQMDAYEIIDVSFKRTILERIV